MQVTQTMYLHVAEQWDKTIRFQLMQADMSEYGYICVGKTNVTFDVPENFDIRQPKAKAIEKEMAKVRADFQTRITELQRTYNELLAIEGA